LVGVLGMAACGAHSFTAGLGSSSSLARSPSASTGSSSTSSETASGSTSSETVASSTSAADIPSCDDPKLEFRSKAVPCKPRVERADPVDVYLPDGRLDKRAESGKLWVVLEGFSPAEATQRAKAAGYAGDIEVARLAAHDPACKAGTVCRVEPFRWEFGVGSKLTLLLNPTVTISTPE
jgi:hypothetical protein